MVRDFLFGLEKVLNITTAEVSAIEAKRFAANQRNGLGLNLADVPGGLLAIHKLFRCGMSEDHVSQFVQRGLMWESGNGIHCDFAAMGEALNVAVQLIKRTPGDPFFERDFR